MESSLCPCRSSETSASPAHYLIQRPRVERIVSAMLFWLQALGQFSSLDTHGNLAEWIFCLIGEETDTQ